MRHWTFRVVLLEARIILAAAGLSAGAGLNGAEGQHGSFDVTSFGAKGDGFADDTAAINEAIKAANDSGGGTVEVCAGTYLSGSIHLRSYVTLHLGPGATVVASSNAQAYDAPEENEWGDAFGYQDAGHSHWHDSLVWGEDLTDVSITGPGRILGKGLSRGHTSDNPPQKVGNKAIALKNCRNVVLRDFTIEHGGWFGILATGVDNLTIDGLRIDTNRDGMDIDCCRNVKVSNCSVNSPWDDGICLKSSFGLGQFRATEDVTISNLVMRRIFGAPIFLRLGARMRGPAKTPPGIFKGLSISNVLAEDVGDGQGILILGLENHPVERVALDNIHIEFAGGGTVAEAGRDVPEMERDYPEPGSFGVTPSWGLYARHAKDLVVSRVELRTKTEDLRPSVVLEDVAGVEFEHVKAAPAPTAKTFVLKNVAGFSAQSCQGVPDTQRVNAVENERL